MSNTLHTQQDDNGVLTVWFDHTDKPFNTFSPEALDDLEALISSLQSAAPDGRPAGMIFASAKRDVFVSGADLFEISRMDQVHLEVFIEQGQQLFDRIAKLPWPTVAAIGGHALGGGFELALACDWRVAADKGSINIGLPETMLGLLPGWGGTTRLARMLGPAKALSLILPGKTMPPRKALRAGLIDDVVRPEALPAAARRWLKRGKPKAAQHRPSWLARLSMSAPLACDVVCGGARRKTRAITFGNYPAADAVIDTVMTVCREGHDSGLKAEREALVSLGQTEACQNLIRIFFLRQGAKRAVRRRLGDDASGSGIDIQHAAVIGSGTMGAGIAHALIGAGIQVRLVDVNEDAVAAGLGRISKLLDSDRKAKRISPLQAQQAMQRIAPTTMPRLEAQGAGLKLVDFAIEAVAENIEVKRHVFQTLDRLTRSENGGAAVLASNTSSLSISELAAMVQDPSRVIGLHFFNPVPKMPLIEVVRTAQSSHAALSAGVELAMRLGKTPVLVADAPGFLVNRVLIPYLAEALVMASQGASIVQVDHALKQWGMPMGPFELLDQVGLDIGVDILNSFRSSLGDRLIVPEGLEMIRQRGWLGKKGGIGFYRYGRGRKQPRGRVNEQLVQLLATSDAPAGADETRIDLRLVLPMVNEAARALSECVVDSTDTIDLATVLGLGLAPFRSGLVHFAESFGFDRIVKHMDELAQQHGPRHAPCEELRRIAEAQETMQALVTGAQNPMDHDTAGEPASKARSTWSS